MPASAPLSLARRGPSRIRPDLAALAAALARLGSPQLAVPSVLVVGTNGKGSTAAMLESMLAAHGVAAGLYTSPHLLRVEERIRLRGAPISTAELERWLNLLEGFPELTYFETLTAVALLAFAEARVPLAVLEAGMGGRWDATRVAGSAVAGLTNVGTDHRRWLGATRQEIARDKGAALAAACAAVLGPGVDEEIAGELGADRARPASELAEVEAAPAGRARVRLGGPWFEVEVPFAGRHQLANLHLALALLVACHRAGLAPQPRPGAVRDGLAASRWPGRLTRHRIAGREVVVDGAHNLEGAAALAAWLDEQPRRHHLLFSCLEDKPVEGMAALLLPRVESVAVVELEDERALALDRLRAAFPGAVAAPTLAAALAAVPDPVLAAGSLRLAGALLEMEEHR